MEEQLISFETAKLAKEKRFNLGCSMCYDETGKNKKAAPLDSTHIHFNFKFINYSAPTQSFLQKWLREVHNIIVFIEPKSSGSNICKFLYNIVTLNNIWILEKFSMKEYDTYEASLEEGLYNALQLIK